MRATVYPSGKEIEVTEEDVARGYTFIECPACRGTGTFEITDTDSQDCVRCSTRGVIGVSV